MQEGDFLRVERLYRLKEDSKVKAFVDIAIGDFVIKGLKLVEGRQGLFLAMPQEKAKDGKWYNAFYPKTKDAKESLFETVLKAFES